jgi:hypothetical protein
MRSLHDVSPMQTGGDVRKLQSKLGITVDGQYGPLTQKAVRASKYRLGFPLSSLDSGATVYYLEILYGLKPAPKAYAGVAKRRQRKVAAAKRAEQKALGKRGLAVHEAGKVLGEVEHPAESNRGPGWIDTCQLNAGHGRFAPGEHGWPWCGCAVHESYRRAGVTLPGEIRSVRWLYNAAHAGHPQFSLIRLADADVGDIVILFSPDTHMALVRGHFNGKLPTREGNTSPADQGSQDNGGGEWDRQRSASDVVAVIRVHV